MYAYFKRLFAVVIIISTLISTYQSIHLFTLDYSINKCPGTIKKLWNFNVPSNHSRTYHIRTYQNITSSLICEFICFKQHLNCWMSKYDASAKQCDLYNKIKYVSLPGKLTLSYYECNVAEKCLKLPNKCQGYQVDFMNLIPDHKNHLTMTVNVTNIFCENLCKFNHLCGSYMFDSISRTCILYKNMILNVTNQYKVYNDALYTKSWVCCLNSNSIPNNVSYNRIFRINGSEYHKSGIWVLDKELKLRWYINQIMVHIDLLDPKLCLRICSNNPYCTKPFVVWASLVHCYLILDESIGNNPKLRNLSAEIKNISDVKLIKSWSWMPMISKLSIRINRPICIRFKSNSIIKIKSQKCLFWNTIKLKYSMYLFKHQTDSIYNEITININDQIYLYKYIQGDYDKSEPIYCEYYLEYLNLNHKPFNFVSRQQIYLKPPKRQSRLNLPVGLVSILNTYMPNGRCFHFYSCSDFVRKFQILHQHSFNFYDIAYNFLIGEDGRIYEGRGWNYVGAHTRGNNIMSIGVAFIGWFENVQVNHKALVAFKQLIDYGKSRGYLTDKVIIKSHRALRQSEIPGVKLHQLIKSFDFHFALHGIITRPCSAHIYWKFLYASLIIMIILLVILSIFLYYFIFHHKSQLCQLLTKKYGKEINFKKVDLNRKIDKELDLFQDFIYILEKPQNKYEVKCTCFNFFNTFWIYSLMFFRNNFFSGIINSKRILFCSYETIILQIQGLKSLKRHFIILHLPNDHIETVTRFFSYPYTNLSFKCICHHYRIHSIPFTNDKQYYVKESAIL